MSKLMRILQYPSVLSRTIILFLKLRYPKIERSQGVGTFSVDHILELKAPVLGLADMSAIAFALCDMYCRKYLAGHPEALNRLIACLYYDENGFDKEKIESNAGLITLVNKSTRELILKEYRVAYKSIIKTYPNAFLTFLAVKKMNNLENLVDVLDCMFGSSEKGKLWYQTIKINKVLMVTNIIGARPRSGIQLYKGMFLEPTEYFHPESEMLKNGTFQDSIAN